MSQCIEYVCTSFGNSFLWPVIRRTWPVSYAVGPLSLLYCLFSHFISHFTPLLPHQCSSYQTVPTSPCSVYTPLSRCHHTYISCQVELASFSPSCCSAAKNKAPFCGAAMRLQSGPPRGLKLHFLTNRLFQESEATLDVWLFKHWPTNMLAALWWSRWCNCKKYSSTLISRKMLTLVPVICYLSSYWLDLWKLDFWKQQMLWEDDVTWSGAHVQALIKHTRLHSQEQTTSIVRYEGHRGNN